MDDAEDVSSPSTARSLKPQVGSTEQQGLSLSVLLSWREDSFDSQHNGNHKDAKLTKLHKGNAPSDFFVFLCALRVFVVSVAVRLGCGLCSRCERCGKSGNAQRLVGTFAGDTFVLG